jgi:glycosyltransferase involved in cell wall biosynthesis
VAVSRGWTAESFRVRLYERLDRFHLRWMDRVVCVSEAQAEKVRRAGVRGERVRVIHNAIDPDRFADPDPLYRAKLKRYFRAPRARIVGAAGRLSPEKGFDVLVGAARRVLRADPSVGFVLFGEGPCRTELMHKVHAAGLAGSFVLAGFRADLDPFLSHLDLLVLPSHTEGLPNVVLEACAAGTPVVATAVGGNVHLLEPEVNGLLVAPGRADELAAAVVRLLRDPALAARLGAAGRRLVHARFSQQARVQRFEALYRRLCGSSA